MAPRRGETGRAVSESGPSARPDCRAATQPQEQPTQNGTFITLYPDPTTFTYQGGYYPNPTGALFGRTNYAPNAGAFGPVNDGFYGNWVGPFYNRSVNKIGAIPDGTSNTIFFGDLAGAWPGGVGLALPLPGPAFRG